MFQDYEQLESWLTAPLEGKELRGYCSSRQRQLIYLRWTELKGTKMPEPLRVRVRKLTEEQADLAIRTMTEQVSVNGRLVSK